MLEKTIGLLKNFKKEYGYTVDEEGAKLIHPLKELKNEHANSDTAFLCELFPQLTDEEIEAYSSGYQCFFPQELKALYSYTNGCCLLNRFISVAGLIAPDAPVMSRSGGRTPWSLRYVDTICNAKRQKKYWGDGKLFFAQYQTEPQAYAFFDCTDPSVIKPVHLSIAGQEEIIKSWPSFDDWFFEEAQLYLNRFYNNDYRVLNVCGIKFINFDQ